MPFTDEDKHFIKFCVTKNYTAPVNLFVNFRKFRTGLSAVFLVQVDILFCIKRLRMVVPDTFQRLKIYQKSKMFFLRLRLCRIPMGSLQRTPCTLAGSGAALRRGENGERK